MKDGPTVSDDALRCLWALEDRGDIVAIVDGRLRLRPRGPLSQKEKETIAAHHDDLVSLVRYVYDRDPKKKKRRTRKT
jgi:hypothetical protein